MLFWVLGGSSSKRNHHDNLIFIFGQLTALVHVLILSATSENLSKSPSISALASSSFALPSSPFSSTKIWRTRAYLVSDIFSMADLKSKPIDRGFARTAWEEEEDVGSVVEPAFRPMGATGRKALALANRKDNDTTAAFMVLSVLSPSSSGSRRKGRHCLHHQQGRSLVTEPQVFHYKTCEALLSWEYRGHHTARKRSSIARTGSHRTHSSAQVSAPPRLPPISGSLLARRFRCVDPPCDVGRR